MDHLLRDIAPVAAHAWQCLDAEATDALRTTLTARKLFEVTDPLGWDTSAVNGTGAKIANGTLVQGASVFVRQVHRMVEIKVPFEVERVQLDALARGAKGVKLDAVSAAARTAALAEDRLIFDGLEGADIDGAIKRDGALLLPDNVDDLPRAVSRALATLRDRGVEGPYVVALAPHFFEALGNATIGGYPVSKHVERLVDGPLVWAPALEGGVVASRRGGDFEICLGADFAVGYTGHTNKSVEFYIEELLSLVCLGPEACIGLQRAAQ